MEPHQCHDQADCRGADALSRIVKNAASPTRRRASLQLTLVLVVVEITIRKKNQTVVAHGPSLVAMQVDRFACAAGTGVRSRPRPVEGRDHRAATSTCRNTAAGKV